MSLILALLAILLTMPACAIVEKNWGSLPAAGVALILIVAITISIGTDKISVDI